MVKGAGFLVLEWSTVIKEKLDELFTELVNTTELEDIGFHKVENGRLKPVYKTNMGELSIERWKSMHGNNPVYIENNPILQEVVNKKKTVVISNTKEDSRTTDDVNYFNVNSLMMIPIIKFGVVTGVICIVSIGKQHSFSSDEVRKCKALVQEYLIYLI